MVQFLILQIRMGNLTLEQVPARYYTAVQTAIKGGENTEKYAQNL